MVAEESQVTMSFSPLHLRKHNLSLVGEVGRIVVGFVASIEVGKPVLAR